MELSKNTVFISGGASGIGFALAKEFLNYENTVIICGRSLDKLRPSNLIHPLLNLTEMYKPYLAPQYRSAVEGA